MLIEQEEFDKIKKEYIDNILQYIKTEGSLFPHITIFAKMKESDDENDFGFIHIPMSDEFLTDEGKILFIEEAIPKIVEKIHYDFDVFATGWASEAFLRETKDSKDVKDYKNLPVKNEIVILNIESELENEFIMYDIKREGKQITSTGEMVDIINLEKIKEIKNPEHLSGTFSGLFKKFKKLV